MAVLYLDKIGVAYVIGIIESESERISKISAKIE